MPPVELTADEYNRIRQALWDVANISDPFHIGYVAEVVSDIIANREAP